MANPLDMKSSASGLAALSICESLLIALSELKVISAGEASGILADAASTHRNAGGTIDEETLNLQVAMIIERLGATSTLVRHS